MLKLARCEFTVRHVVVGGAAVASQYGPLV
jgi:hypothetical protein